MGTSTGKPNDLSKLTQFGSEAAEVKAEPLSET
jgi:hypothetical protein